MPFYDLAGRTAKELFAGVTTQTFWGDKMLLSWVTLEPHAVAPAHSHPHEQAVIVLDGELLLQLEGATHTLAAGAMFVIPGDVEHIATAGAAGCTVVDVFSPVREALQY